MYTNVTTHLRQIIHKQFHLSLQLERMARPGSEIYHSASADLYIFSLKSDILQCAGGTGRTGSWPLSEDEDLSSGARERPTPTLAQCLYRGPPLEAPDPPEEVEQVHDGSGGGPGHASAHADNNTDTGERTARRRPYCHLATAPSSGGHSTPRDTARDNATQEQHTHTHANIHTRRHTHTRRQRHTHANIHTHADKHTHPQTDTARHTHTHTRRHTHKQC